MADAGAATQCTVAAVVMLTAQSFLGSVQTDPRKRTLTLSLDRIAGKQTQHKCRSGLLISMPLEHLQPCRCPGLYKKEIQLCPCRVTHA